MTIPLNHEANNAIHPHARILFVDDDDDSAEMRTTQSPLALIEAKTVGTAAQSFVIDSIRTLRPLFAGLTIVRPDGF
jgi:hypothetical protein